MSKFNVETAFGEMSKKISSLTTKLTSQSSLIEALNNKIEDQQKIIENNIITITEQTRVIGNLSATIDKLVVNLSSMEALKSKKVNTGMASMTLSASETNSVNAVDCQDLPKPVTERERRAMNRITNAASTQPKQKEGRLKNVVVTLDENTNQKNDVNESEQWNLVINSKKTKKHVKSVQIGGNSEISAFQAVQKKKFLHVWSLHIDTSEKALVDHVTKICGTNDVKVEKIIPKTKRDYSSFMVGVPEMHFDKINCARCWPVNSQFNEWIWFRNFRKPAKSN